MSPEPCFRFEDFWKGNIKEIFYLRAPVGSLCGQVSVNHSEENNAYKYECMPIPVIMHVHMYACTCACMCVCIHTHIRTDTHTHSRPNNKQ
jgi:hypothetical protein